MEKLPIEFKEKWVAALRSGEYKQTTCQMFGSDGSYCCLGVAAHLLGMTDVSADPYMKLPEAINGGFENPTAKYLMQMNDGNGSFTESAPFSEIADYIEANL